MTEIKNNHQAVLKLQRAKNYFEDVAIEANQPPTVLTSSLKNVHFVIG